MERKRAIFAQLSLVAFAIAACGTQSAAAAKPSPSPTPSPSMQASSTATPVPPSPSPGEQLGPGGLTLDEEIGAVMMVGFRGPLSDAVLADWRRRQFGGLLVVNLNHNADSTASMQALISSIRGAGKHRLIAATDQEGGGVCIALPSVPCYAMPVGEHETTQMASALKEVGFDLDLGPVSDVCSGQASIMWGRCYGTDPGTVEGWVRQVAVGIHSAHMLAAAKHFPGHGDTSVSSEYSLPRIDESVATLEARGLPPFEAASSAGVDFVLLGHLYYPALDPHRSADLTPATITLLRSTVGFQGAILSDDMEMGAITDTTPAPVAAVQFLQAGGDMVMIAHDLTVADATYDAIKTAVLDGQLPRSRLDDAVATLQRVRAA